MGRVVLSTYLDAAPETIWAHANTTRLLNYVAAPLIRFRPVAPPHWPEVWADGEYVCSMRLFGVLPIGRQTIVISRPPPEEHRRFIRDNGFSAMIRRWDHLITISPEGTGTRYEDRLDLDAGLLTPIVAGFARVFYGHRQSRWRRLVADDFSFGERG